MAKYLGKVAVVYVNVSKKGKEYATGYVRLPDANGNPTSYKFLVFDDAIVANIKTAKPEALKGKDLTFDGEFKENTWNGNTEFQLMVNGLEIPEDLLGGTQSVANTGTTPVPPSNDQGTVPTVPTQEAPTQVQENTQAEVPSIPTDIPQVPTEAPTAPSAPTAGDIPTPPTMDTGVSAPAAGNGGIPTPPAL